MDFSTKLTESLGKFFLTHKVLIFSIIINVIIIYISIKALDLLYAKVQEKLKNHKSEAPILRLVPVLIKILKILILFVIIASFLQSNGYSVTSLIAGFGIVGMAVGFAAKETIANVFGSFAVIWDRVYKVGDFIRFNGMEGTVTDINFRSTKLITMDNYVINIPNNIIADSAITNITTIKARRIDMFIGIEYSTSNEKISKAVEILKTAAINNPQVEDDPLAFVSSLDDSQITLRLYVNTKTRLWAEYCLIKDAVIREIIKRFREEGIEFAFPSQTVYVQKNEN